MASPDLIPDFTLPESALQQPVSWDKQRGLVSLREFIAFHGPERTRQAFGILPEEVIGPVKKAYELTEDELLETACARIRIGTEDLSIAVTGVGSFTIDEVIDQMRHGVGVGPRLLESTTEGLLSLEGLIEAGKLIGPSEVEEKELPDLPQLPF